MFQVSAYTIDLQVDSPDIGKNKINTLISGYTSPFNLWSGTSENLPYLSVFRRTNYDLNGNNILGITGNNISVNLSLSSSGNSPLNLIANGYENNITSQSNSDFGGGVNFISGVKIKITAGEGNLVIGSGNTISSTNAFNFIHGIKNNILGNESSSVFAPTKANVGLTNNSIVSSNNSNISRGLYNSIISAKDSSISSLPALFGTQKTENALLFGNNNLIDNNIIAGTNISFTTTRINLYDSSILNGTNNKIGGDLRGSQTTIPSAINSSVIFNGSNNVTGRDFSYLFGSNLTAVTNNYSHFENLRAEKGVYSRNYSAYTFIQGLTPEKITISNRFSYFFIKVLEPAGLNPTIQIKIENPSLNKFNLLFVSIFNDTAFAGGSISFVDTFTPTNATNIACKSGSIGSFQTSLIANEEKAYAFMWNPLISKWVMFTSDPAINATF
jgi:hypothetical protein